MFSRQYSIHYFFLKTAVAVTPFTSISTLMTSAVTVLLITVVTPCLDNEHRDV